jgi:hypothetical protein
MPGPAATVTYAGVKVPPGARVYSPQLIVPTGRRPPTDFSA